MPVQAKHYQIACKRYFEATHPIGDDEVANPNDDLHIAHPNQYFEQSEEYWKRLELKLKGEKKAN